MKKIVLALAVVFFMVSVSGQSLQNFEYSPEDDFEVNLTGGEGFNQTVNFSTDADQSLPFGLQVTVESNSTEFASGENLGAEFDLDAAVSNSTDEKELEFEESLSENNLVYTGSLPQGRLAADSDYSLELRVDSNPAIKPDNFKFGFEVTSKPGFGEVDSSEIDGDNASVDLGDVSVSVETEQGDNVTVEEYDRITVPEPEDEDFISGTGVEVVNEEGEDVEAEGTVSIGYGQSVVEENGLDESSMQVYFYNESSLEWTTEGVENISRDLEDNVVEADVTHFSTYGAFAERDQEDDEDSGGGSSIVISDSDTPDQQDDTQDQQDNQTNTSEETDQEDRENEESTDERQDESQDQQDSDDSQQQNDRETSPGQGITGQFLGSPTNVGGLLVGLLVAMVAALQYFGKIELRSLIELVREKLEQIR